ncbi:hypothetical protein GCM10022235_06130 [Kribbella ginsengisoli]|uniref:Integrase n=1 Tax=Kribbella ginsengisoli TaxID=363865 RepID=A0ABP6VZD5_9ACTN
MIGTASAVKADPAIDTASAVQKRTYPGCSSNGYRRRPIPQTLWDDPAALGTGQSH